MRREGASLFLKMLLIKKFSRVFAVSDRSRAIASRKTRILSESTAPQLAVKVVSEIVRSKNRVGMGFFDPGALSLRRKLVDQIASNDLVNRRFQ